jgi:erythromycin esterase-like protein
MGGWLKERFRDELYPIGIYANRGQLSAVNRAATLSRALIACRAGAPAHVGKPRAGVSH